jgi:hypothetical protein
MNSCISNSIFAYDKDNVRLWHEFDDFEYTLVVEMVCFKERRYGKISGRKVVVKAHVISE